MSDEPFRLVVASANPEKVTEILAILEPLLGRRVEIVARPAEIPDIEEDGDTLLDNARLKAVTIATATGQCAVADDTGLEVEALGGGPGVRSGRYAGEKASYEENVTKLLDALDGVTDRRARFRTVAFIAYPDGREIVSEGTMDGEIAEHRSGTNGFGYDSVFVPTGSDRSCAELDADEKRAISHRGRAFRALGGSLLALLDDEAGRR